MPRYDDYRSDRGYERERGYDRYDRYDRGHERDRGNTRLYVGHLSTRTRSRDLDRLFSRYGRVRDVDMKNEFAFIDFSDPRDADDARYSLDGCDVDGSRITVEFARGTPRGPGGAREYMGRGPPPGSGRCFNCGLDGHWARDCKAGDWKNKCYRCGERGHVEKNCNNSPKKLSRDQSYSPSPVGSRSPCPRGGRSHSRSRSYSRSKSPLKRERSVEHREKRSRSTVCDKKSSPLLEIRKHRPMSGEGSPKEVGRCPSPDAPMREASYSDSPKERSKSPGSSGRDYSPEHMKSLSPSGAKGRNPSPGPKEEERSHVYEDEDDNRPSPSGSKARSN